MLANCGHSGSMFRYRVDDSRQPRDGCRAEVSGDPDFSSQEPSGERTRATTYLATFGMHADAGAAVRVTSEGTTALYCTEDANFVFCLLRYLLCR